jgi:hypothetical protein
MNASRMTDERKSSSRFRVREEYSEISAFVRGFPCLFIRMKSTRMTVVWFGDSRVPFANSGTRDPSFANDRSRMTAVYCPRSPCIPHLFKKKGEGSRGRQKKMCHPCGIGFVFHRVIPVGLVSPFIIGSPLDILDCTGLSFLLKRY